MILVAIPFSACLLWAACGFMGLPAKARTVAHATLSVMLVVAMSSLFVMRVAGL